MDKKYKTFKPTDLEFKHGEVFTQTVGELLDIFKHSILDDLTYHKEHQGLRLSIEIGRASCRERV